MICVCIDLKSFFASVECVERGLDPMTTNLVVADPSRTDKTICLAVSPSMKAMGVKNRCRVFEIPKTIEYITAPPRMQKYIDYAAKIYGVYLKYVCKDDIHVYSIDEVFIDATDYLDKMHMTPKQFAEFLMSEVLREVGVRATAGIGTNLYLAKIALDITAKHAPDFIGYLDEDLYRETLWDHQPLMDFWMIGRRTQARLDKYGIHTMRDIAHADEDFMYKQFGINAELIIDHAWGRETCTIADIKAYTQKSHSVSSGQVLYRDYKFAEAEIIVREMADAVCQDLLKKGLIARTVSVMIGYTHGDFGHEDRMEVSQWTGKMTVRPTVGTASFEQGTNSDAVIVPALINAYRESAYRDVPIRRVTISCAGVSRDDGLRQMSLFDPNADFNLASGDAESPERKKLRQEINAIKKKYGKNAVLKGTDFQECATMRQRNEQIGGHKA